MNVAILHYHLNRGGVAQVIANQLRSLEATLGSNQRWRIGVLYGGRREGWSMESTDQLSRAKTSLVEVPSLDYDDGKVSGPHHLADSLQTALDQLDFAPGETIIHAHNHALGKNVSLPGALNRLADRGYRLLLQIHDFAEDYRPDNYSRLIEALAIDDPRRLPSVMYPQASHIWYAVLNGRDERILGQAGLDGSRLHRLANPVSAPGPLPPRGAARTRLLERFRVPPDRHFMLYPVRCIRRKNIGEALLWSALAEGRVTVGLTLAPLNPAERRNYCRWREFAESLDLPCLFDVGGPDGLGYLENLAAADSILTTSVAEGFGLVYLESWTVGCPLVGRDLPEITADFVAAGVEYPWTSPALLVPIAWVGKREFQDSLIKTYARSLAAYRRLPANELKTREKASELLQGEEIDFGRLSGQQQQQVIRKVHTEVAAAGAVRQLNPWIEGALMANRDSASDVIQRNAMAVQDGFSLEVSGRRLHSLYQLIRRSPVEDHTFGLQRDDSILDSFLDLTRLQPIRLEP